MKHTDFHSQLKAIQQKEKAELLRAVEAHGGKVTFPKRFAPVIGFNLKNGGPTDVTILEVEAKNGRLSVRGTDEGSLEPREYFLDEAFFGHISYIIDEIPSVKVQIDDVTIK